MNSKKQISQLNQLKRLGKKPKDLRLAAESWRSAFQILIATILSARTRDETTISVAEKLFRKYPTPEKFSRVKITEIEKIIKPVNFYKNKSRYLISCSKIIEEKFDGKVPLDFETLISLPGVGRKTANVFLSELGNDAIGVDTHLSYVSRMLKWSNHANPHKIEKDLQKLFPRKYWSKINPVAVRFGKTYTSRKKKDKLLNEIKKIK